MGRLVLTCLVLLFTARPLPAAAESRVALIIGNGRYDAVANLPNPTRDADSVAAALRKAGFSSVQLKPDLTRAQMIEALRAFGLQAESADWAVIYYAGHGLEMSGVNYLVPVDARLASDKDVQDETISLDRMLSAIEGARKLRLVVLDACRNNPFLVKMKRSFGSSRAIGRGLAGVEPEAGTLVVYAAAQGQEADDDVDGKNSPFASAFVRRLAQPGVEVRRLFDVVRDDVIAATRMTRDREPKPRQPQQPFAYGSLPGSEDFYFVEPTRASDADAAARADFEVAKTLGTAEAWDAFLNRHPSGLHALAAQAERGKLGKTQAKPSGQKLTRREENVEEVVFFTKKDISELWPAPIADCDRHAASPFYKHRPPYVEGVKLDKVDVARAIPACRAAVAANPEELRFVFQLGRALGAGKQFDEAARYYREAADEGDARAMNSLALAYENGNGVARNLAEAIRLYRKAADAGDAVAMYNLADMYERGAGTKADRKEAKNWYAKAAGLGDEDAKKALTRLR